MNTQKLKKLEICVQLILIIIGTICLAYQGISIYYIIHRDFGSVFMYLLISLAVGIYQLILADLKDAIDSELDDRHIPRFWNRMFSR